MVSQDGHDQIDQNRLSRAPRGRKAPLATHADFSACGRLAGRCATDRRAAGRRAA